MVERARVVAAEYGTAVTLRQLCYRLVTSRRAWCAPGVGLPEAVVTPGRATPRGAGSGAGGHDEGQQVIDLELKLQERDDDLAAARGANRELMAQINRAAAAETD
ncbi:hypothetical protein GCM10012286_79350 [Streptomyces lasiicapitis]|uniref:Transposase n=1 Tax=Streptomyces lasiicapitis TaxID=1923961 RepID=A0ABQ2MW53_9ACTN|nr:hypothetical protein GCM10012286_79350 [Streptomyces lasiicapitis]